MVFIRDGYNARKVQSENLVNNFQLAREKYYPIYLTVPVRKSNGNENIIYLMKLYVD